MKIEENHLKKESNFISAIIYFHNCETQAADCLETVQQVLSSNFKWYEIICVDDCCTDRTLEQIRLTARKKNMTTISIIHMGTYQGVEAGMIAGINAAIGDYIFEFDRVEIDYNPELMMEAYRRSTAGSDVVSASPKGSSQKGKISSRLFYAVFNRFSNFPYQIQTDSFRCISRRAINRATDQNSYIFYRKASYATCGLKNEVLGYEPTDHKMKSPSERVIRSQRWNIAIDSMMLFTDFSYRFCLIFSVVMMLLTLGAAFYTVVIFLMGKTVEGWTTTMMVLSVGFFGVFTILMMLTKYASIIVRLLIKPREYTFSSIEKVTNL